MASSAKIEVLWSKRVYFGILGNAHILVSCPIMYYCRIKVYRVKIMDMKLLSVTHTWLQIGPEMLGAQYDPVLK